jgi:hypothetical protein
MRRRFRKLIWIAAGVSVFFGVALCIPDIRVRIALRLIPICPERFSGSRFSLNTHDNLSSAYSLADLSESTYQSYQRRLPATPKTYFWLTASMETQTTVWQFNDYYINLYATSDIDRDVISIGVFPGRYEKPKQSDDGVHDIEYSSPKRFFYADR